MTGSAASAQIRCGRSTDGVWLSLVERLVWDQEVPGSNPGTPTTFLRMEMLTYRR